MSEFDKEHLLLQIDRTSEKINDYATKVHMLKYAFAILKNCENISDMDVKVSIEELIEALFTSLENDGDIHQQHYSVTWKLKQQLNLEGNKNG